MKKVFITIAAVMLIASPAANAQALLNKLKEKAGEAMSGALSEKISEKVGDAISKRTGIDLSAANDNADGGLSVPDSRETLQPKRSSSFGWDGKVTPSKAEFPIPLMNEFPAVPAAAKLANPTEEDQIAYYKAIKAVTLRAEELNADTTCEDSFTEQWRAEAEKAVQDAFGITEAEMKALNEGSLTPAQQEALEDRMRAKIMGGVDLAQLEEQANKTEGMTEDDIENMAYAASAAVFDRHDAELRKYFNASAEEYKKAAQESMKSGNDSASKALEKKAEAMKKYGQAAILEMIVKALPEMASAIAEPLSTIDKVTIIDSGNGDTGVSSMGSYVPSVLAKTIESVKETTGIDIKDIIKADTYDAKVNKNINVTGLENVQSVNVTTGDIVEKAEGAPEAPVQ